MPIRPRASRSVDTPEAKASPRPDHRPKPHQIATRSLAPSRNRTDLSTCAPPAAGAIASGNLLRRAGRHRHQSAPFHDTKTNSQSPPCPAPCPGLSGGSGGCCPSRERVHSGGLKQIRGSWLCPDRGLVTRRPPVDTGPRECVTQTAACGPAVSFPGNTLHLEALALFSATPKAADRNSVAPDHDRRNHRTGRAASSALPDAQTKACQRRARGAAEVARTGMGIRVATGARVPPSGVSSLSLSAMTARPN